MRLKRDFDMTVNHKKVRRSMKIQGLQCLIRRKKVSYGNQYSSKVERAFDNKLNQNFSVDKPDAVYSADVTEIRMSSGQKAYFHMVKDLATNEIVSHNVSNHPDAILVTKDLRKHLSKLSSEILKKLIYHTDQGGVFMSDTQIGLSKYFGIQQSMSRRGNCLDNAPIESFFGHLKDEVDFRRMKNIYEVNKAVQKYVDYYNFDRPQWRLKKMTPAEYRSHLM